VTYRDATELDTTPKSCPLCGGAITTLWVGQVNYRVKIGHIAVASPRHACTSCGIAVRVMRLDVETFATKDEARASVDEEIARRNA
jgi:hypothetical protein